ncbi:MAG: helix-turn-helix transcriptional regulator [Fimbriimonas sp.]
MTRVERLTALVLLLQEGRRSADWLADQLCVSRRTVIRDAQALLEMGVPVDSHGGPGGGYEIARGSTLAPLHLTWREALLLMMAMEGLTKMADTPFAADRASLSAKLRALLPESQQTRVAGILERVGIEVPVRPQRAPFLDALMERLGQWADLDYDGKGLLVRIDRVYAEGGLWYAQGVDAERTRVLRVDRVRSVAPAEVPPVVAEPLPYDHPSHPTVRVRLTAAGARRVEREPHLGRHAREGTMEFRCPPSELDWYARYFGGMGPEAHVEGPPELVERIVARAQNALRQYDSSLSVTE